MTANHCGGRFTSRLGGTLVSEQNLRVRQLVFGLVMAGLMGIVAGKVTAATVYNNATDYSITNGNPNGVWSYGMLSPGVAPDASTFTLYTVQSISAGLDVWSEAVGTLPLDFYNPTNMVINPAGTNPIQPGQAGFHPGPDGEYSVFRFTAPAAGPYSLSDIFTGVDEVGTTTDVHVLDNGSSLFAGNINGYLNATSYSTTLTLALGERIDFVVGFGSDGNYSYDSTALDATLTTSPLLGDVNRDGQVTVADIQALMNALSDLNAYKAANPNLASNPQLLTQVLDLNGDGVINNLDVQALIALVANGGGSGSLTAVPEPASIVLLGLGALAIAVYRRSR